MAEETQKDIPLDEVHAIPLAELEIITLPELIDISSNAHIIEGMVIMTTRSYSPDMRKGYNSTPSDPDPSPELDEEYP